MLRLGYKASAEQFGPRDLLDFAIAAEEAGFDSVFVSDHFQPWRHTGGHAPFSFAWMGALGARTSHIAIGTSVLTPTFRYHPSVVAQAFGTLGALFPGRVILGVGTGEALNKTPSTGMEWPEPKERLARLKEGIELIRRPWTEDRVTFDGAYYRVRNATIYDRPETPVPIYIAGAGPARHQICWPDRRWFYLHLWQAIRALPRDIAAKRRRRPGCSGTRTRRRRSYDRNEGLVRHR